MQLKHQSSLTEPTQGIMKVTAVCWAPNGKKLAMCTTERSVLVFDENGVRKDKFATKPADKVLCNCSVVLLSNKSAIYRVLKIT